MSAQPDQLNEKWTSATGLECEIIPCRFNESLYHLCGYVRIPESHPLYRVKYQDDVPAILNCAKEAVIEKPIGKRGIVELFCISGRGVLAGDLFDVHGSITFSRERSDGSWWYGFDCGHAGDDPRIQDSAYVRAECESLAHQVKAFWVTQ